MISSTYGNDGCSDCGDCLDYPRFLQTKTSSDVKTSGVIGVNDEIYPTI